MTLVEVVILALVQGLTEFLPVSSSGHLLLARWLFNVPDTEGTTFDAFLHLGTLGALVVYYWRVWLGMVQGAGRQDEVGRHTRQLIMALLVATVPAAVAGYVFKDQMDHLLLRGPRVLSLSFLFTAFVLWWFDQPSLEATAGKVKLRLTSRPAKQGEVRSVERGSLAATGQEKQPTFYDALIIGLAQVLALVPAISRSGVTIAAGRSRGFSRKQATTFSFLMSAPIIAGAGLMSLGTLLSNGDFSGQLLLVGTVVSFISGLVAIVLLMRMVERISFIPFSIYLVLLSAVVWIFL